MKYCSTKEMRQKKLSSFNVYSKVKKTTQKEMVPESGGTRRPRKADNGHENVR